MAVQAAPESAGVAVEPHDLEAEENVLGACMMSPRAIEETRELVTPADFYRHSHGEIYGAILHLQDEGGDVDPIRVRDYLEKRDETKDLGPRIREIVAMVAAAGNAKHYAAIVAAKARARDARRLARRIIEEAERLDREPELVTDTIALLENPTARREISPLWWSDALNEQIPEITEYVDGVLEAGVLADIVGLPYLHKTAIALELAVKVARGSGWFLGQHEIVKQAPVAYLWADDSRARELERVQKYSEIHNLRELPIGLYLNPGLTLPKDLATIKGEIRKHGYRLVIFDSLYNFCPGIDWSKDHAAVTGLYAALKRICDEIEGLTIVLVDHAAKPSDGNRGRAAGHTSFGSIFKAASVRCTIAVEKAEGKLSVSATGNNVRGFERSPAYWNQDELEVRLVDNDDRELAEDEMTELDTTVLDYVKRNPGKSGSKIATGVKRRKRDVSGSLRRLAEAGLAIDDLGSSSMLPGTTPDGADDTSASGSHEPGNHSGTVPDDLAGATSDSGSHDGPGTTRNRSSWRAL